MPKIPPGIYILCYSFMVYFTQHLCLRLIVNMSMCKYFFSFPHVCLFLSFCSSFLLFHIFFAHKNLSQVQIIQKLVLSLLSTFLFNGSSIHNFQKKTRQQFFNRQQISILLKYVFCSSHPLHCEGTFSTHFLFMFFICFSLSIKHIKPIIGTTV